MNVLRLAVSPSEPAIGDTLNLVEGDLGSGADLFTGRLIGRDDSAS
jgi:hypothetical protein